MERIIEVSHLQHKYGDYQAIQDLSFDVQQGEVFGLLGPNGAGKTTTVRLLNGMFEPSGGSISVMGIDPVKAGEKIREKSGVLTETPALYERLTARQNLRFFGVLAGMDDKEIEHRTDELLEMFDLRQRADDRTGTYSKGMKQRLALSRAWLTNPKLLFLDEPTSGLDPEAAAQVRELIADVRQKEGTTVLICTHNLNEAQRLCNRLLVMRQGSSLAMGSRAAHPAGAACATGPAGSDPQVTVGMPEDGGDVIPADTAGFTRYVVGSTLLAAVQSDGSDHNNTASVESGCCFTAKRQDRSAGRGSGSTGCCKSCADGWTDGAPATTGNSIGTGVPAIAK